MNSSSVDVLIVVGLAPGPMNGTEVELVVVLIVELVDELVVELVADVLVVLVVLVVGLVTLFT